MTDQNVHLAVKKVFDHFRKTSTYYQIPESWLAKMTLNQLTATGETLPSVKSTLEYNANLFLKAFDVSISNQYNWNLVRDHDETTSILEKMIGWSQHMEKSIGTDFVKVLKYALLAHHLTANKYDVALFKEYIEKPAESHSELNDKARLR